jgi:hypothetical protein
MEQLIETIRSALDPNADDNAKAAGASACRTVLAALETEPGKPLAPPMTPSSSMAMAVQQLRNAPPSLVLDALIAKLKTYLPEEPATAHAATSGLKIPFVPLPRAPKEDSGA